MKETSEKRKRVRSLRAIAARIFIFTFILWATAMFGMTIAVTQLLYSAFVTQQQQFSRNTASLLFDIYNDEFRLAEVKSRPGGMSALMQKTIGDARWQRFNVAMSYDSQGAPSFGFGKILSIWNWFYEFQSAVMFIDMDGNILMESGGMVGVNYIPQDAWATLQDERDEDAAVEGRVQFNMGLINNMAGSVLSSSEWNALIVRVVRITGFMDSGYIHPISLHYVTNGSANKAFDEAFEMARNGVAFTEFYEVGEDEHGPYESFTAPPISTLDHAGLLQWQSMLDKTGEVEDAEGMVTVYGTWPSTDIYSAGKPVTAGSVLYDSVLSFLHQRVQERDPDSFYDFFALDDGDHSLCNIMVAGLESFSDYTGYDFDSGEHPEPDFIMLTAIHSSPLRHAISSLLPFYLITLYIAVTGAGLIYRTIKRNLTVPLDKVNTGIADGWTRITSPDDKSLRWREPIKLFENYEKTQETLRVNKNELTRLNTALAYAEKAEENRRQMTSNIAHELKTPLAIIHSYSEGLKERIAEDKREQYLNVILSESERMDVMVLEMLDLSRLEAGKVKLARDDFSLSTIVKAVFAKLELAVNEKELAVTYELDDECLINADEARISQTITNFAVNAVKYTPRGGNILVKTYTDRGKTGFTVGNDCDLFSSEDLVRVWDAFYRTDSSRTDEGTGLGLAIVKSIIDLHGGKCSVRNTENGVEFGFTI